MTTPTEPRVLADTGGLVVTDDGRRVLVFDRRTGALAVTAFVLWALLGFVVGRLSALVALFGSRPGSWRRLPVRWAP